MRINPINNNMAFRGIVQIDPKAPNEIFGDRYGEFETISDSKGINIIPLKLDEGPMVNKVDGYIVALQGKEGTVFKNFKVPSDKKSVEKLKENILKTLIWAYPESNYTAAEYISSAPYFKDKQEYASRLASIMYSTAASSEAKVWREKINRLGNEEK